MISVRPSTSAASLIATIRPVPAKSSTSASFIRGCGGVTALTILCLRWVAPVRAQYAVVPYLLQGEPAPGTGASFESFDRPNINGGAVSFAGDTDGATNADDVVYLGDVLIAQQGQAAVGTPGTFSTFEFFESSRQNASNLLVAYIATLTGVPIGAGNRAIYSNQNLVAYEGDPAPNLLPADNYSDFGFASQLDNGDVGFLATLDSGREAIYRGDQPLFVEGETIPAGGGAFAGKTSTKCSSTARAP